jgi:hypothetical protein
MMRTLCWLFALVIAARVGIASEPWPQVLQEFPRGLPSKIARDGFAVVITEPRSASTRDGGGSGGPMLTFTVSKQKTGWASSFDDQSVGTRLLKFYHGYPQLEIWGRGGGGSYSRCLHRFVRGEYRCVRIDEFTEFEESARNKSITTTLPGGNERLYFVETRIPDDE